MARYRTQIDWLSVVFPTMPMGEGKDGSYDSEVIERVVSNEIGEGMAYRLLSNLHPLDYGRAPYARGWKDDHRGVTLWCGGNVPHFTVEFSGKGVAYLRETGETENLLERTSSFLSRIDLAIDLETDLSPDQIVAMRKGGRQQSNARFNSPSGDTCYIGSPHSERYMRVYRYAPPHPRANLLRLEMVFRRAYAKSVGAAINLHGLTAICATGLDEFGFSDLVDFGRVEEVEPLTPYRPERNGGKTLRWLITQVAPAFRKAVSDGVIPNAEAFLWEYFIPESTGDNDDNFDENDETWDNRLQE